MCTMCTNRTTVYGKYNSSLQKTEPKKYKQEHKFNFLTKSYIFFIIISLLVYVLVLLCAVSSPELPLMAGFVVCPSPITCVPMHSA